jgi:hypothetical protein
VIFFPPLFDFFLCNSVCGCVIGGGWLWSLVILCMGLCKMGFDKACGCLWVCYWGRLVVEWC